MLEDLELISTTMSGHEACPVYKKIHNGEGSLPVCDGPDNSNCDSSFFTQLSQEKEPEEEDNDRGEEIETSQKIKTYKDANMHIPKRGTRIS